MRYMAECKVRATEMYKATPVVLVPAATGPGAVGLSVDRRCKNERTMDRVGNARNLDSHARSEWVTARAATYRRPRPGRESASHSYVFADNPLQRIGNLPMSRVSGFARSSHDLLPAPVRVSTINAIC